MVTREDVERALGTPTLTKVNPIYNNPSVIIHTLGHGEGWAGSLPQSGEANRAQPEQGGDWHLHQLPDPHLCKFSKFLCILVYYIWYMIVVVKPGEVASNGTSIVLLDSKGYQQRCAATDCVLPWTGVAGLDATEGRLWRDPHCET